ncbi:MAG: hypothetical protein P4L81_05415 [Candidatus Pacebacteria bacterium]|nr:hypothetical protein [Candidatus Paceibacterota bacterium]
MNRNILKSIWAGLAGFVVGGILSYGTDYILGLHSLQYTAPLFILGIIFYRSVYVVIGCYITARLAPNHPMRHVLVLGLLGLILGILGSAATWDMNVGPHWYGLSVATLALPSAWLGGKLSALHLRKK